MKIHWWEDSGSRYTCHENVMGASFDESIRGYLVRESNWRWFYVIIGVEEKVGPFEQLLVARKALEAALHAEPVDTND